jgi:hypothetical protein
MAKLFPMLVGAALLVAGSVQAQTACEQCGTAPPPPPPSVTFEQFVCRVKGNAGVGNGGDQRSSELKDCDPGKSGAHNQAWKNINKPRN